MQIGQHLNQRPIPIGSIALWARPINKQGSEFLKVTVLDYRNGAKSSWLMVRVEENGSQHEYGTVCRVLSYLVYDQTAATNIYPKQAARIWGKKKERH